jgi:tetratricopeptide repeat protein 21B
MGVIHCQLLEGNIEEAAQQIDFLNEIQSSLGPKPVLGYFPVMFSGLTYV